MPMETDLNKIMAEIDRNGKYNAFISYRKGEWDISLGLDDAAGTRQFVNVGGKGPSFRAAFADTFRRIEELASLLEMKPNQED